MTSAARVRDRVRHPNELDAERSELQRLVTWLSGDELRLLPEPVLVELGLHERERQRRRDHGIDLDLPQEVRQPADVVLVSVREHDGADAAPLEVADVRQQEVDTEVLVAREGEPRVDDDDLVPELVDGHVLADLAEAAERDDPQRVAHGLSLRASARRARSLEREDVDGEQVAVDTLGMQCDVPPALGQIVERGHRARLRLAVDGQLAHTADQAQVGGVPPDVR